MNEKERDRVLYILANAPMYGGTGMRPRPPLPSPEDPGGDVW